MRSAQDVLGTDHVYCINLARRPERWVRARDAIVAAGFPAVQRVEAVDGATVPFDDPRLSVRLASIVKTTHQAPLGVRQGVIGCYLSHVAVWQRVVEEGVERCVIFEDDVKFGRDFPAALRKALEGLDVGTCDALFFGYLKRGAVDRDGRLRGRVWGTQSYLVTQRGARKLLERALPLTEPLDEHLGHLFALDDSVVARTTPRPLTGQTGIASDITPVMSYTFGHKLARALEGLALLVVVALIVWWLA